jgi:hypothetical protein
MVEFDGHIATVTMGVCHASIVLLEKQNASNVAGGKGSS